jgi:hypothetical protein
LILLNYYSITSPAFKVSEVFDPKVAPEGWPSVRFFVNSFGLELRET